MEDMIGTVYEALSEQRVFDTERKEELYSTVQGIIPQDLYKHAEPVINELLDEGQRSAFMTGFKNGVRMMTTCMRTEKATETFHN